MDDLTLIEAFIDSFIQGEVVLLSNPNLRCEPIFGAAQLLAKKEGIIAIAKPSQEPRSVLVKQDSLYWEEIHQAMVAKSFLPIGTTHKDGFANYQHCPVPNGYQMNYTEALQLWVAWCGRRSRSHLRISMDLLILNQGSWSPLRDLICRNNTLFLKTLGPETILQGSDRVVWLKKVEESNLQSEPPSKNSLDTVFRR